MLTRAHKQNILGVESCASALRRLADALSALVFVNFVCHMFSNKFYLLKAPHLETVRSRPEVLQGCLGGILVLFH